MWLHYAITPTQCYFNQGGFEIKRATLPKWIKESLNLTACLPSLNPSLIQSVWKLGIGNCKNSWIGVTIHNFLFKVWNNVKPPERQKSPHKTWSLGIIWYKSVLIFCCGPGCLMHDFSHPPHAWCVSVCGGGLNIKGWPRRHAACEMMRSCLSRTLISPCAGDFTLHQGQCGITGDSEVSTLTCWDAH